MACSSKQEISMATIKFIILRLHSDPPSYVMNSLLWFWNLVGYLFFLLLFNFK